MFTTPNRNAAVVAAVFATSLALAGCGMAPGDRVLTGGVFGGDAAVIGSVYGDTGKAAVIGGVGGASSGTLDTAYPPGYGAYDYKTHSYGGNGFSMRCVRFSPYTGHCAEWLRS